MRADQPETRKEKSIYCRIKQGIGQKNKPTKRAPAQCRSLFFARLSYGIGEYPVTITRLNCSVVIRPTIIIINITRLFLSRRRVLRYTCIYIILRRSDIYHKNFSSDILIVLRPFKDKQVLFFDFFKN